MSRPNLSLAFSPCPNDTYIFGGLVNGHLANPGFELSEVVMADVETLNQQATKGVYDITKLSFHAFGHVSDKYLLLPSGSALGRGCGPLLVAQNGADSSSLASSKIAIPGRFTTAAMLLKLCAPEAETVVMRFEEIISAVVKGEVDAGVIIHESRFTYEQHGLSKLIDLGVWWEKESGGPIPLGGIAIKRELASQYSNAVDKAIKESIKWAQLNQSASLPYIQKHAQELSPQVVRDHIALYVNNFSLDLADEGRGAVCKFLEKGNQAGLFDCDLQQVFF